MNIKKLNDKAIIPTKGSKDAAGYDLYTTETYELKPGERKAFKTDISISIPTGLYGRIAPRSGLAVKNGIDVLAGVIDSDYRGEILVALINFGQESITLPIVKNGKETPIAQIIFEHHTQHEFNIVENLNETERNIDGFGSSDIKTPIKLGTEKLSLIEMYSKFGGISVKEPYSEEIKNNK